MDTTTNDKIVTIEVSEKANKKNKDSDDNEQKMPTFVCVALSRLIKAN